jgi:uncharacterized protein YdiU (UPF0061 family)
MEHIHSKNFKNTFTEAFPGDISGSTKPRQTPGKLYSLTLPTPVAKPALIGWSNLLAAKLNIADPDEQDVSILGGNMINPTMAPYAACYAGHQFGNWAGQLGDGRAITLGEWKTGNAETWELQLKGAGPTAYSRRADGRAVLRSSVREFLMSEAMHHLGIPTTRALSLVATGDKIVRDMFYNGNPQYEPGAIVARMAPSFLRFGNFEMLAARQELEQLQALTDWTIEQFFPQIQGENRVLDWLAEIVERTATMIVEWMRVGFVHGVMNTDNMSILGLTIDYGPFSFVDNYDPDFTPNTTDLPGKRYAFGKQASVAYWNLGCLANAIAPLVEEKDKLIAVIEAYEDIFWTKYSRMMANKLGFDEVLTDDTEIIQELERMMSAIQPDMTIFYQLLIELPVNAESIDAVLKHFDSCFYQQELTDGEKAEFFQFVLRYQQRRKTSNSTDQERTDLMKKTNPRFVLRNYLLHMAITDLEKGDDQLFRELQSAIKNPYSNDANQFFKIRPVWASEQAGCSMLSCSS